MSYEKTNGMQELLSLPKDELKSWVETRYTNRDDSYIQELKNKQLRAIETENVLDLENLSNVLFVSKENPLETPPERKEHLDDLYKRLMQWIKPRL